MTFNFNLVHFVIKSLDVTAKEKILVEAMRLTGRSRRCLLLWQREGCDLTSLEDLQIWHLRSLQYSRGQATNQILAASSRLDDEALFPAPTGCRKRLDFRVR